MELSNLVRDKQSLLCVGLDPDPLRLPTGFRQDAQGIVAFCREVVAATQEYAVAFKINVAFFEALGVAGWSALAEVADALPHDALRIADAKRGDIGNSSAMYAKAFFDALPFDAITLSPYMGRDSIEPFLQYEGKHLFLLALTSNPGAGDFQTVAQGDYPLYEQVVLHSQRWKPAAGKGAHLGYVAGATQAHLLSRIRLLAPEAWLLVPGVGAQGGDLDAVCHAALTPNGGLLLNASRSILYADSGPGFAEAAAAEAERLAAATARHLERLGLLPQ